MGNLVETGLGWYLDEDYLLTLGSQQIGTVTSGGGQGTFFDIPNIPDGVSVDKAAVVSYGSVAVYAHDYMGHTNPIWVAVRTYAWSEHILSNHVYAAWIISTSELLVFTPRGDSTDPTAVWSFRLYWSDNSNYWSSSAGVTTVDGVDYLINVSIASNVVAHPDVPNYTTREEAIRAFAGSVTRTVTKVQGGAGAFAMVSYPRDGDTVYVGVGISSIPNPNSAATVAVDGVNGSYDTFNRESINFTMFYTPELSGTLSSNVPVVSISDELDTSSPLYTVRLFLAVANAAQIHAGPAPQSEDPYEEGGTSQPGGGGGSFDDTSDQIDDSTTPVFSFAGSGFCRIYNPNLSQLQNLANYLWTDTNFLQTVINHAKQLLEDPIEAIISLAMLPVAIPQGTSETVKVLFISTGVSMPPATTQYVDVDCGAYTLEEYYGSALDYNPYTQVDLFLPFIGQVSLNTDEVMGHTISVKYRVDIVSGLCVAKVFVDNDCMYQFSGNCAIFMPLNSADFSSYLSAAMTAATALVSAGAGVAAGSAAAGAEAVAEPAIQTGGNLLTSGESLVTPQMALQYRVEESVRPMYSPSVGEGSPSGSLGEMERKFINNSAAAVMGSKISFEHASHLAGNSGILGVRRPYLIINRPDMCNPANYGKYNGRPCMMYLHLGSLTGYTEVQEIQLTGFSATNPELSEISKMLKGGVIF